MIKSLVPNLTPRIRQPMGWTHALVKTGYKYSSIPGASLHKLRSWSSQVW